MLLLTLILIFDLRNVLANAARKLGILCKASYIYDRDKYMQLVLDPVSFIFLEYCSLAWVSAAARDLSFLGKVACGGRFLYSIIVIHDLPIDR